MMNARIKGVVGMHLRDKFSWFYLPWIILMSSFVINVGIAASVPDDQEIVTGGLASIFIYMLVCGIVSVHHTFPFALGLSVRRRDYFGGTMLMILSASAVLSVMLTIFSAVESASEGWGVQLSFFHLPFVADGSVAQQWVIYASLMIFMYLLGFACSCVYRRFGRTGLYTLAIASFLAGTAFTYAMTYRPQLRNNLGDFFSGMTAFDLALLLVPAWLVLSAIAYALLRRSTN